MIKLIVFGADWCSGCKTVKVMLDQFTNVAVEYINIDENIETAREYNVRSIPTYINKDTGERGSGTPNSKDHLAEILNIPVNKVGIRKQQLPDGSSEYVTYKD